MKRKVDAKELDDLQKLADWMDSRFVIPGTSIRFGLDSLLGLVPGIGDTVTVLSTGFLVKKAHEYGLPHHVKITMMWNMFVDWLIGLIPIIGDLFDIGWKANQKNVALIRKYVERAGAESDITSGPPPGDSAGTQTV
jgi:hypothetical protein